MKNTLKVPKAALFFAFDECELKDNGEGAKTAPIKMVARSKQPVTSPWFGKIWHDFEGMSHKNRIVVDYCHDDDQVIGYLNKFDTSSGDLVTSGALVPYKESDRATEIIHKHHAGVPYEASIYFTDPKIQELDVDEVSEVNGEQVEGPGLIVREWTLRGVAVCPYGRDQNTSSKFSEGDEVEVEVFRKSKDSDEDVETTKPVESKMSVKPEEKPEDQKPEVEQEQTEQTEKPEGDKTEKPEGSPPPAALTEPEEEKPETDDPKAEMRAELKRYMDAFGQQGAEWFAEGLDFAAAQTKFVEALQTENMGLKTKLDALSAATGEESPIEFSDQGNDDPQTLKDLIRVRK